MSVNVPMGPVSLFNLGFVNNFVGGVQTVFFRRPGLQEGDVTGVLSRLVLSVM